MLLRKECHLRVLEEKDLELVLGWRNSDRIRANMFTDHIISLDEHREWFEKVANSLISKHFIFEYNGSPKGVVNVTAIDTHNNKCDWGFYVGGDNLPPGASLAMGYLGLEYIFEVLNIRKLYSEVFGFNTASIKFHKKLGFIEEGYLKAHALKNGRYEDVVCMALFQDDWLQTRDNLAANCFGGEDNHE